MRLALYGVVLSLLLTASLAGAPKTLQIYLIDVEGGQATLFVSPAGQSLLVDTGWGYNAYRDANRIVKAAKMAKVKKIDFVVVTHYHSDHVGGVPQLVAKLPVGTFLDHGESVETSDAANHLVEEYKAALANSQHRVVTAGDHIDVKGLNIEVVSAAGNVISTPLAGAGEPNKACDGVEKKADDPTENARSVGLAMQFGKFRTVDLGDLTWNKELDLMCPANRLGHVDLLVVSHHGSDLSSSPALVHGLEPRVAIMDNGAKKGGSPSTWDIIHSSPHLEDIWQLHFANAGGHEHNTADPFIANVDEGAGDLGWFLKVTAHEDGSFEVYNPRNKLTKPYPAR